MSAYGFVAISNNANKSLCFSILFLFSLSQGFIFLRVYMKFGIVFEGVLKIIWGLG